MSEELKVCPICGDPWMEGLHKAFCLGPRDIPSGCKLDVDTFVDQTIKALRIHGLREDNVHGDMHSMLAGAIEGWLDLREQHRPTSQAYDEEKQNLIDMLAAAEDRIRKLSISVPLQRTCQDPLCVFGCGDLEHNYVCEPMKRPIDAQRTCQAEDQSGWPCGAQPVVWQLTPAEVLKNNGEQMYFCEIHRTNKFIWKENECEPVPSAEPRIASKDPASDDWKLAEWWLNESMDEDAIGRVDMKRAAPALRRLLESVRYQERQRRESSRILRAAEAAHALRVFSKDALPYSEEAAQALEVAANWLDSAPSGPGVVMPTEGVTSSSVRGKR